MVIVMLIVNKKIKTLYFKYKLFDEYNKTRHLNHKFLMNRL
jgi:hypothetical protein